MTWVEAGRVDDLEAGEVRQLETEPPIALYNVDGELYATQELCSHAESPLADGYLEGDVIECAWHMARFCVRDGRALSLPATVDLTTYPVKVVDGVVLVGVGESLSSPS